MKAPYWSSLLKIRRVNIYQFAKWGTLVVPVIIAVEAFAKGHLRVNIPMPVNLLATYVSSLSFLASSLIVDLFCPDIIKEHRDFDEFYKFAVDKAEFASSVRRKSTARIDAALSDGSISEEAREATKTLPSIFEEIILEGIETVFLDNIKDAWKESNQDLLILRIAAFSGFICAGLGGLYISFYDAPSRVIKSLGYF